MTIGIDYDNTFTVDPLFWKQVIKSGLTRGHIFVCVTNRHNVGLGAQEVKTALKEVPIPIVFCEGQAKRFVAEEQGYHVDVWIDDSPKWIDQSLLANS